MVSYHNTEDLDLNLHCHENLESHTETTVYNSNRIEQTKQQFCTLSRQRMIPLV